MPFNTEQFFADAYASGLNPEDYGLTKDIVSKYLKPDKLSLGQLEQFGITLTEAQQHVDAGTTPTTSSFWGGILNTAGVIAGGYFGMKAATDAKRAARTNLQASLISAQAQEAASASDAAKAMFVANTAHDIAKIKARTAAIAIFGGGGVITILGLLYLRRN